MNDIKKLETHDDKEGNVYYVYNSISAECINGSRMTLLITDFNKFHRACTAKDEKGKSLLDYANYNLQDSYYNKAMPEIESQIDETVNLWKESKINKLIENKQKINIDEINSELNIHRYNIQKHFYKQLFKDYFNDNIKEFEDLGMELTMGWVKDK